MRRAAAPASRITSRKLRTECDPSVFWSPYRSAPMACSIFTRFQSASSSSAATRGREVRMTVPIKPPGSWRYIGKGMASYDLTDIVAGEALYGMDARVDGMVYASIEHPPVFGGTLRSYDDKAPLKRPASSGELRLSE